MAAVMGMEPKMRRSIFLRALMLQSCWNFERMQNIGFAYCAEPWLRRSFKARPEEGRSAQERHLEPFNTQPFMAGLVLGMVCALEEDIARAAGPAQAALIERLKALKAMTSTALAGIGDSLFWATLRPSCAALALACAALSWNRAGPAAVWLSMAGYLIAFNVPALVLRWRGIGLGFLWKDQIAAKLCEYPCQTVIRRLRFAGFAAALAVGAALFILPVPDLPGTPGAAALAATAALRAKQVSTYKVYAAVCVFGGIASALGWA